MALTFTLYLLLLTIVIIAVYNNLNKKAKNNNVMLVDVGTIKFDEKDVPLTHKDGPLKGQYVIDVVQKNYPLKIPVNLNSEDTLIRPPFIECKNKLWVVHTVLQLNKRTNLIVLPAGEPTPEKSAFCFDADKPNTPMQVVK